MATGYPTINFSESSQGLFSPREIRHLMSVEYDRALRFEYPLVLALVQVDRLEFLHDLYGLDSKEEILTAVISQLRSLTRQSDFLGCMQDDHILAAFPHTDTRGGEAIAGRVLRGARDLRFESNGRGITITLSIGLAALHGQESRAFAEFLEDASRGLQFAERAGGDRYVRRETASDMIEELREELQQESERLAEEVASSEARPAPEVRDSRDSTPLEKTAGGIIPAPPAAGDARSSESAPIERLEPGFAADQVRKILARLPRGTAGLSRVEKDILAVMTRAIDAARSQPVTANARSPEDVDRLERRVEKLKELLDQAEREISTMARTQAIDPGKASIYKSVQGLASADQDFDQKREMLTVLFEANVNLRKEIDELSP